MREVEMIESDLCKKIHAELKDLCGDSRMIVFDEPIKFDSGSYREFDAIAVCSGILMARCVTGWCDKPIQPYHANVWIFGRMNSLVEKRRYEIESNPIAEHKPFVCV